MKIRGKVKCPLCGSFKTYPWNTLDDVNLHDDKEYEDNLAKSKEYTRLDKSTDNIIVGMYCLSCETTFSALLTLKVEIDKIYTDRDKYQLQMMNLIKAEGRHQKEEEEVNEN